MTAGSSAVKRTFQLLAALVLMSAPACYSQDWGQAVESALAAAGSHNTIVDMTGLSGPQSSRVNPFAGLSGNANIVVKIGCYDITTAVPWVINASHVRVEFCSSESQLKAAWNFPAAPLITVGDNTFPVQDVLIEYGYMNCINVPGCTAYVGNSLNEFSGLRHVNAGNTQGGKQAAILINGTTQTMGHYILEDVQVVDVGANDCIGIVANGVNQHRIHDITCNNAPGTPTGRAGVHITALGYNQTEAVVERVHVEGFNDGVFFDNRVSGTGRDLDCTNGCTNGVHIGNSCSDIVLSAITVTVATNIVRNDCSGKSVPLVSGGIFRTLAFYLQSNYGGNPPHATYWNGLQWITE
jgi:hypothetical protein